MLSPLEVGRLLGPCCVHDSFCCFFLLLVLLTFVGVVGVLTAPLKVGCCPCFNRTLGGWAFCLFLFLLSVLLNYFGVVDVSTASLKVGRCLFFDRTLGGWVLSLLLFFLGNGCLEVLSPKGRWGGVDDAACARGCWTAMKKRRWAIRQAPPTTRYDQ